MEKFLKIALILGAVDRASAVIENAVKKGNKELDKLGKSSRVSDALASAGQRATIAGTAITGFFGLAVNAAEDAEVATNRLDQVFRSMGDNTGKAAKTAADYASALSLQIGVEDEAIMMTQAKLATFAKVSNETARMSGVFDRATAAAHDLAAAGFGDASSNAVQLGKALQDPIKGITALARSGVTFTAQEKEKIKTLTQSGKLLDAQNIILKAVETQVGGVAAATATDTAKMAIGFGEVQESLGKALLPELNKFAKWLSEVAPKIQNFIQENPGIVKAFAAIGVALAVLGPILLVASAAVTVFSSALWASPITWIVVGILALIAVVVLIIAKWDKVAAFFSGLWEKVKGYFSAAWEWIKNLFLNYTPAGLLIKHWNKIVGFFSGLWDRVKAVFSGIGAFFLEAGINIVKSIGNGIKSGISHAIDAIKNVVHKVREYLPFSPAKTGPLKDIHRIRFVETIAEGMKPNALTGKVNSIMRQVRQSFDVSATSGPAPAIAGSSAGGSSVFNFNPQVTINGGGPQAEQSFRNILNEYKDQIIRIVQDESARAQRRSLG